MNLVAVAVLAAVIVVAVAPVGAARPAAPRGFADPPREFSVLPFWFWNDALAEDGIRSQIADFDAHGVYGFVIHPRVGLPDEIGWLSPKMIALMRVAIEEAARRRMHVVLYDEGMYPSGSSSGQVVARNPAHAARGLAKIDLKADEEPVLQSGWKLVAIVKRPGGGRAAVVDRPSGGVIRGLHFRGEGTARVGEETPPAGDILNPAAVDSFVDLVYARYGKEFGSYFGKTVIGIFTDEPSPLGRDPARGMVPGNTATLDRVSAILGYDFRPHLADLWYDDAPDSAARRADYHRAVGVCLEEIYYSRLSGWCRSHGIALMGHPAGSMDLGAERYFGVPGQDLVWRMVVPGPTALNGPDSTTAKCASSAMVHLGRRRNSTELYGAYGHELTYDEMQWLASWCFVRGHNMLIPHAFYYSVRGPRFDERPPDVGPHSAWWDRYRPYADFCRRLSWLNTDSKQVCDIAILAESDFLPQTAAKVCFESQRDFNYLELRDLGAEARADSDGVQIGTMRYRAVVLDGLPRVPESALPSLRALAAAGRLVVFGAPPSGLALPGARLAATGADLRTALGALCPPDVGLEPAVPGIRCRHVVKEGVDYYMLFNEGEEPATATLRVAAAGSRTWLDPFTGKAAVVPDGAVSFERHQMRVLMVTPR